MRYSEYFVQVALLAEKGDVVEAERLLREGKPLPYRVGAVSLICGRT